MYTTHLQLSFKCCGWWEVFKIPENSEKHMFIINNNSLNCIYWLILCMPCIIRTFFYKKNHGKRYSSCEISMSQDLSLFVTNSFVTWLTCHIMRPHQSLRSAKVVKPAFKRRNVTLSSHIPSQRLRHFYLLRHYNFCSFSPLLRYF